jgi:hypothetical protein
MPRLRRPEIVYILAHLESLPEEFVLNNIVAFVPSFVNFVTIL